MEAFEFSLNYVKESLPWNGRLQKLFCSNHLLITDKSSLYRRSLDSDINEVTHRPVIQFKAEIYESLYLSKSQDNVVAGVFDALYR